MSELRDALARHPGLRLRVDGKLRCDDAHTDCVEMVRAALRAAPEPRPETAALNCPHCGGLLHGTTDARMWAAPEPPREDGTCGYGCPFSEEAHRDWQSFDGATDHAFEPVRATPAEPGLLKGLNDAHAALASAVMWLDGEYVGKSRAEFNREAWGRAARTGLAALVAARQAEPAVRLPAEGAARLSDNAPGLNLQRLARAIYDADIDSDAMDPDLMAEKIAAHYDLLTAVERTRALSESGKGETE